MSSIVDPEGNPPKATGSLIKGTVTIEKQHITVGVAATLLLLAFAAGRSFGSSNTSSEVEFRNINIKLESMQKSMDVSEGKRDAYSNRVDTSIGDMNRQIAVLTQRVDDISLQVSGRTILTPRKIN